MLHVLYKAAGACVRRGRGGETPQWGMETHGKEERRKAGGSRGEWRVSVDLLLCFALCGMKGGKCLGARVMRCACPCVHS